MTGKNPSNPNNVMLIEAIGGPMIIPRPDAKINVPAAEVICLGVKKSFA